MDVSEALVRELKEQKYTAGIVQPYIVNLANQWFNSRWHTPYCVNSEELGAANRVCDGRIVSTYQKTHDHAPSRIVEDYVQRGVLSSHLESYDHILFIGSTYKEVLKWTRLLPNSQISGLLGTFDAKDEMRHELGRVYAKRDLLSTDPVTRAVAADYLTFLNTGVANRTFVHASTTSIVSTVDCLVGLDVVYDISTQEWARYLQMYSGKFFYITLVKNVDVLYTKNSVVPDMCLEFVQTEPDWNYCLTKNSWETLIMMRHTKGKSNGYVHKRSNYEPWVMCNFHDVQRNFTRTCWAMETIKACSSYEAIRGCKVVEQNWDVYRSLNDAGAGFIEIFDVVQWLLYRRYVPFVIEKKKGEALFHFCIRVSPDSYEPTKIASYMVNLMSRMIVNGAEIQSSWNIDSPLSIKALLFYLTYAAVVRGSMYKAVGRAIKSSQLKEGGSYDYWFIAKLRVLYHFVTGETRRVLQPLMEDCIYKTPRYLHEWHDGYYTSNPRMAPCIFNSMQEGNDVFDAASKLQDFPKKFTSFFKHAFGPLHVKKVDIDPEELGQMLSEVSEKDIDKWQDEHPVEPYVAPRPSAPPIDFSLPPSVAVKMERVAYTPAVEELTAILMSDGRQVQLVPNDPVPKAPREPDPLGVPARRPLPVPVKRPVVVDWGNSDFGEKFFFTSTVQEPSTPEPTPSPPSDELVEDMEAIVTAAEPDPQEEASAPPEEEEDDRETSKNLCKDGSVFHGSFNQAMNLDMSSVSRICSYASKILRISPELIRVDLLKNGELPALPAWDPRDRLKHQLRHLPFLTELKGDSFLDVGGGDSSLAEHLSSKFKVSLCVDPVATPGKYAIAKKIQEVGGSFEVVLANMSLHHFGGITAVSMLANRVSPGGFLVIREHDLTHIEARALDIVHKAYSDDCGRTQYVRRPTLLKRLEELGFLIVKEKIGSSPLADFTIVACKMGQASDGTCGFSMPQEKAAMLLDQYKNHQFLLNVKKEYDNYQDLHKEVDEAIKNLQPLKDYSKVDVTFWDKTAGARKTQEFLNLYDPNKDLYICHSADLLAEWHEDCKKAGKSKHMKPRELPAKTFEKALSLKNLASRRYIMLDECFQYPVAYQVTLFTLAPQAKFILGGHSLQSEWNWEGFFTEDQRMTTHLKYYTKCKKSDTTYRFAENHSAWLRASPLKVPIWTSPDFVGPDFKLRVLKFGSEDKGLPSFVLSEKGQRHLASMNIVATTVRVRQGFSKTAFNWYITPQCLGMLGSNSLMFVAFTRAKEYLNVVYLPGTEGSLEQRGYQMPNIQMLTEQALGMAIPAFDNIPYEGKTPLVAPQPKPAHGKFDGAALKHALFGVVGDLNNVQEAYTSVLDEQVFVEQWAFAADKLPTQRHVEEKRMSSSAFGKIFKHSSPKQNIATMLMRNANNAKLIKMKDIEIADWSKFSERFWKLFVKEDVEIGLETQLLAQSLQAVYKKYITKFGPEAISLENSNVDDKFPPGIEPFLAVIRGHLKDISKVRGMGAAWLAKHGQEISAWATAFNGAFCAYFRTLQEKFISMLKPQFIYAANKSDDQIAEQFANMPDHKFTMTRDWEFYDTNMNKLTQQLEAHGMEAMFRLNSRSLFDELCGGMAEISAFVKIYRHESKASGRPDTFFSNTYLGMMFSAFLVASLVGGAWAGDDALELCDAAESDVVFLLTKAMKDLNVIFPSTFKLETTPIPEFCGHLWSGKHYFYDPVRVAIKLICRRWSTERNYEEYKLAVRDHLKVWMQDQSSVERLTALYHGTTKEHIEALIFQLHSFVEGSTWKEFSRELDRIWVTY